MGRRTELKPLEERLEMATIRVVAATDLVANGEKRLKALDDEIARLQDTRRILAAEYEKAKRDLPTAKRELEELKRKEMEREMRKLGLGPDIGPAPKSAEQMEKMVEKRAKLIERIKQLTGKIAEYAD